VPQVKWFALAAALLQSACASASFANGVYAGSETTYRVGSPGPEWRFMEVDGNDLAFHRADVGTISANSTCSSYEDVPPRVLLNHLLFGMTERHHRFEEVVAIDGRGALHSIVDAELDGVPVTLDVYVLPKDGCLYDLSLVTAPERHHLGVPALRRFIAGFTVLGARDG
jgi:hypothetical protein